MSDKSTEQRPLDTIARLLDARRLTLEKLLPRGMSVDRLRTIALMACDRNPALLGCTPVSIVRSILQAAEVGLEPGGVLGEAYLVPFRDHKRGVVACQLIVGYRGLVELVARSGAVHHIDAACVHERDLFSFRYGTNAYLNHEPSLAEDRGDVLAVWAMATMKEGPPRFVVLSRSEIDKVRRSSRAADSGPWVDWYEEMAVKTAVRRLCKLLPRCIEAQRALAAEDEPETPPFEGQVSLGTDDGQVAASRSDKLRQALEAAPPAAGLPKQAEVCRRTRREPARDDQLPDSELPLHIREPGED